MQKFYSMKTENGKVVSPDERLRRRPVLPVLHGAYLRVLLRLRENPIVVERQGDGSNSVSGGLHMRWSHRKKKGREDGKR